MDKALQAATYNHQYKERKKSVPNISTEYRWDRCSRLLHKFPKKREKPTQHRRTTASPTKHQVHHLAVSPLTNPAELQHAVDFFKRDSSTGALKKSVSEVTRVTSKSSHKTRKNN
jgi:hypothetical protein